MLFQDFCELTTVDPREPYKDLNPLLPMLNKAQLIGLGEATHGSKELLLIRRRILQFMVENMGCKGLIVETPEEPAKNIDHYIKTGDGDPQKLLAQSGYWVHYTQEMLEVIIWMREYNASHTSNQISFWGCDIPIDDKRRYSDNLSLRDQLMADVCIDILKSLDHQHTVALWSHNFHIRYLSSKPDPNRTTPQGDFLKKALGEKYFAFISLFNQGGFNAMNLDEKNDKIGPLKSFQLPRAYEGTYEFEFAKANIQQAIFDVRDFSDQSLKKQKLVVRETGSMFNPSWPNERAEHSIDLPSQCDGVIWIDKVTPATALSY